ncbi:Uma2 family endonuclease [Stieleria sp. ICT_E10.1]|uniref:Uma2 family endonuclease n=1 Tax=Stieleria sedimenti TaxID=2976331 RepID=UPI0021801A6E|nr:Uma2 family endonuclease [Stieleria sedimenti]MCS7468024.1 Uma2 family endonuclease [Stieleria sedimenti]
MSAAPRYLPHYTVADYRQWEGDWELWQGIPVSMTPSPFGPHQRIAKNVVFEIESQIRKQQCRASVLYEIDWIVSDETVVRPDVVVICGDAPEEHVESPPALVAEIQSESTAGRDREAKRDLYRENGVQTYLLIDPDGETLEAYRRTPTGDWNHEVVNETIRLSICDDCEIQIDRDSLFL